MKHFFILFLVFSSCNLYATSIYRWIDKDGTVHYADQPSNASAILLDLEKESANASTESQLDTSPLIAKDNNSQQSDLLSNAVSEGQFTEAQSCEYIKQQIERAKEDLDSSDELKAGFAQAYIVSSTQILKNGDCYSS